MILAAGLSPAWQQILTFNSLKTGEVNRATHAAWCASGKAINVAVAAHFLGAPVSLISPRGGISGDAIARELEQYELSVEWIPTEAATRVCTTLLDQSGSTTELVEEVADLEEAAIERFIDYTRTAANVADLTVFTGSIPRNVPSEIFGNVMRTIHKRFLLDLRGAPLQYCLPFAPFLVKPNRTELGSTVGQPLESDQDLLSAMRRMNDAGASWVVVSDGEKGVWITGDDLACRLRPPRVQTVNPIGCGDSLAAGIAVALQSGKDVIHAVQFGMGAAACNAEDLYPGRLDADRSSELAEQVTIEDLML